MIYPAPHCFRKTDGTYYFKTTPFKKKVLLSLRRRPPFKDTVFSQRTFITTLIKQESTFSRFSWFSCQSQWSVCGAVQGFISCPSCSGPFNHHTKREHRLLRKTTNLESDAQVWVPASVLDSCVTSSKSNKFLGLSFLICQNRVVIRAPNRKGYCEDLISHSVKVFITVTGK